MEEGERMSPMYIKVEVEVDTDNAARAIDMFHRWRRFVERPSNTKEYGISITDYRIFGKLRENKE